MSGLTRKIFSNLPNSVGQLATATYFKTKAYMQLGSRGTHSGQTIFNHQDMKIKILPALSDNYMYLLIDEKTKEAAIIDPVTPEIVLEAVEKENVSLKAIMTTHHHWDHAGGNKKMTELVKNLTVYGGDDRIDALTNKISHNDTFKIGDLNIRCLFTPCHTTGHICYYVTGNQGGGDDAAVFTGDTLFLGGCGRFFEGDATQMHHALIEVLSSLTDATKVYCGHEYSLQNLKFAQYVEPNSKSIEEKIHWCQEQRSKSPPEPTIPSTIGEEKIINPFMRVKSNDVQNHAESTDPIDTMRIIRAQKDSFKPK